MKPIKKQILTTLMALAIIIPSVVSAQAPERPAPDNTRIVWAFDDITLSREDAQALQNQVLRIPLYLTLPSAGPNAAAFAGRNVQFGSTHFNVILRHFQGERGEAAAPMSFNWNAEPANAGLPPVRARHIPASGGPGGFTFIFSQGIGAVSIETPNTAPWEQIVNEAVMGGPFVSASILAGGNLNPGGAGGTRVRLMDWPVVITDEPGSFQVCLHWSQPTVWGTWCSGGVGDPGPGVCGNIGNLVINFAEAGHAIGAPGAANDWMAQPAMVYNPQHRNQFICGVVTVLSAPDVVVTMPHACPWDTASIFVDINGHGQVLSGVAVGFYENPVAETGWRLLSSVDGVEEETVTDAVGRLVLRYRITDPYLMAPGGDLDGIEIIARATAGGEDGVGRHTVVLNAAAVAAGRTPIYLVSGLAGTSRPEMELMGTPGNNRRTYRVPSNTQVVLSPQAPLAWPPSWELPAVVYYELTPLNPRVPVTSMAGVAPFVSVAPGRFLGFITVDGCRVPTDTIEVITPMNVLATAVPLACPGMEYLGLRVEVSNPTGVPVQLDQIQIMVGGVDERGAGRITDLSSMVATPATAPPNHLQFAINQQLMTLQGGTDFLITVIVPDPAGGFQQDTAWVRFENINLPQLLLPAAIDCGVGATMQFVGPQPFTNFFSSYSVYHSTTGELSGLRLVASDQVTGTFTVMPGANNIWRVVGTSLIGCPLPPRDIELASTGSCMTNAAITNPFGLAACNDTILLVATSLNNVLLDYWSWWLLSTNTEFDGLEPTNLYSLDLARVDDVEMEAIEVFNMIWESEGLEWDVLDVLTWPARYNNLRVEFLNRNDGPRLVDTLRISLINPADRSQLDRFILDQRTSVSGAGNMALMIHADNVASLEPDDGFWFNLVGAHGQHENFIFQNLIHSNLPDFRLAPWNIGPPVTTIWNDELDDILGDGVNVTLEEGEDAFIWTDGSTDFSLYNASIFDNLIEIIQHSPNGVTGWVDFGDAPGMFLEGFEPNPPPNSNFFRVVYRFQNTPQCMPTPGDVVQIHIASGEQIGIITLDPDADLCGLQTVRVIPEAFGQIGRHRYYFSIVGPTGPWTAMDERFTSPAPLDLDLANDVPGLTVGATVWVRMWGMGSETGDDFFTEPVAITTLPIPEIGDLTLSADEVCVLANGTTDVPLTITPDRNVASDYWAWTSAGGTFGGTETQRIATFIPNRPATSAGVNHTVNVTLTTTHGCVATGSVVVRAYATPEITNMVTHELCWAQGNNTPAAVATVSPTAGVTFAWTHTGNTGGTLAEHFTVANAPSVLRQCMPHGTTGTNTFTLRVTNVNNATCFAEQTGIVLTTGICTPNISAPGLNLYYATPQNCTDWSNTQFYANGLQLVFSNRLPTEFADYALPGGPRLEYRIVSSVLGTVAATPPGLTMTDFATVPAEAVTITASGIVVDYDEFFAARRAAVGSLGLPANALVNIHFEFRVVEICELFSPIAGFVYLECPDEDIISISPALANRCEGFTDNPIVTLIASDSPITRAFMIRDGTGGVLTDSINILHLIAGSTNRELTIPHTATTFTAGLWHVRLGNAWEDRTFSFQIYAAPATPTFTPFPSVCANTALNVSLNNHTSGTVEWQFGPEPGPFPALTGSATTITIPAASIGSTPGPQTLRARVGVNAGTATCWSGWGDTIVTVLPNAAAVALSISPLEACAGTTITITLDRDTLDTENLAWTIPGGGVVTPTGVRTFTFQAATAGTVDLTVRNNNCPAAGIAATGANRTLAIITPITTLTITREGSSGEICGGQSGGTLTIPTPPANNPIVTDGIIWQSTTVASPVDSNFVTIAGATGMTHPTGAINATTHFRALVTYTCGDQVTSNTITITVSPTSAPVALSINYTERCSGQAVTITTSRQMLAGETLAWTLGGNALSVSGTLPTTTFTFNAPASGENLLVGLTVHTNNCPSPSEVATGAPDDAARTLTVLPAPPAQVRVDRSATGSVCLGGAGGTLTINAADIAAAFGDHTIVWESRLAPAAFGPISGQATNTLTVTSAMLAEVGTYEFRAIVTFPCGNVTSQVISIVVAETPVLDAVETLTVCQNTATLTWVPLPASAVGLTFFDNDQATGTPVTPTAAAAGTFNFYAARIVGACTSAIRPAQLIVHPSVPSTITITGGSATPLCQGDTDGGTLTITTTGLSDFNIRWESDFATAGTFATISGETGTTLDITGAMLADAVGSARTTQFRAVVYSTTTPACGEQPSNAVPITVNPLPATPNIVQITNNVCENASGQTFTLSLTPALPSGATVTWSLGAWEYEGAPGAITSSAVSANELTAGPRTVSAVVNHGGCISEPGEMTFTVIPNPAPLPYGLGMGDYYLCPGQTTYIRLIDRPLLATERIVWTGILGTISPDNETGLEIDSFDFTLSPTATASSPFHITLTIYNDICPIAVPGSLYVTVIPGPTQANVQTPTGGTSTICYGAAPGTLSALVTTITRNPLDSVQWQSSTTGLPDDFTTIEGTTTTVIPPGGVYVYLTPGNLTQTTWFRTAATFACGGTVYSEPRQIVVEDQPAAPTITVGPPANTFCQGATTMTLGVTGIIPGSAIIVTSTGSDATAFTPTANSLAISGSSALAPGTFPFTVQYVTAASCSSAIATGSFVVNPSAQPIVLTVTPETVCAGDLITIATSRPILSTETLVWTIPGGGSVTEVDAETFTFYAAATGGTVGLTAQIGTCPIATATGDDFAVRAAPTTGGTIAATGAVAICPESAGPLLTLTHATVGSGATANAAQSQQWQWRFAGTGDFVNIDGATAMTFQVPDTLTLSREFRAMVTFQCGTSPSEEQTVTVHTPPPAPTVTFTNAGGNEICDGLTFTIQATSVGAALIEIRRDDGTPNGVQIGANVASGGSVTTPVLATGDHTFFAVAQSAAPASCRTVGTATITGTVHPLPTLETEISYPGVEICIFDPVIFTVTDRTAGSTVTWWQGATEITDATANFTVSGADDEILTRAAGWATPLAVTARVTTAAGCTAVSNLNAVSMCDDPTITISPITAVCQNPADNTIGDVNVTITTNDGRNITSITVDGTAITLPTPTPANPAVANVAQVFTIPGTVFTSIPNAGTSFTIAAFNDAVTTATTTNVATLTVHAIPAAPTFTARDTICQGVENLEISNIVGLTSTFTITNVATNPVAITVAANSRTVTNSHLLTPGVYYFDVFYMSANNCQSATSQGSFVVLDTAIGALSIDPITAVCQTPGLVTVTLDGTIPDNAEFTWTPSGFTRDGSTNNFTGTLGAGTHQVSVVVTRRTGTHTCPAGGRTLGPVQAVVYPLAVAASITGGGHICYGGVMNAFAATGAASPVAALPFTYQWQHLPPGGNPAEDADWVPLGTPQLIGTDLNTEIANNLPTPMVVGEHRFRVLTLSGLCTAVPSNEITVNVFAQPTIDNVNGLNADLFLGLPGQFAGKDFLISGFANATRIRLFRCHDLEQTEVDACTAIGDGAYFYTRGVTRTETSAETPMQAMLGLGAGFYNVRVQVDVATTAAYATAHGCLPAASNVVQIHVQGGVVTTGTTIAATPNPICAGNDVEVRLTRGISTPENNFVYIIWETSTQASPTVWVEHSRSPALADWANPGAYDQITLTNVTSEFLHVRARMAISGYAMNTQGDYDVRVVQVLIDQPSAVGTASLQPLVGATQRVCLNGEFAVSGITHTGYTGTTFAWFRQTVGASGDPTPIGTTAARPNAGTLNNITGPTNVWVEVTNGVCPPETSGMIVIDTFAAPIIVTDLRFQIPQTSGHPIAILPDGSANMCAIYGTSSQNRVYAEIEAIGDSLTFYWYYQCLETRSDGTWARTSTAPHALYVHYFMAPVGQTAPVWTRQYKVIVRNRGCESTEYLTETNPLVVHWHRQLAPVVTLAPAAGSTICEGEVTATVSANPADPFNTTGVVWQLSTASPTTLTETGLSVTRTLTEPGAHTFTAAINNGVCPAISQTASITIVAAPEPFPVTATPAAICVGQSTLIGTADGDPDPTHRWLFIGANPAEVGTTTPPLDGTSNANWALLTNFEGGGTGGAAVIRLRAPVTLTTLDTIHYVRAQFGMHQTPGVTCPPAFSAPVSITVSATPTLTGSVAGTDNVCIGDDVNVSLSGTVTAVRGHWTWQVETPTGSGNWETATGTGVSGTNAPISTLGVGTGLAVGTHNFRVVATNGACATPVAGSTSAIQTVRVWDQITHTSLTPPDTTICQGDPLIFIATNTYGAETAAETNFRWVVYPTTGLLATGESAEGATFTFNAASSTVQLLLWNLGCNAAGDTVRSAVRTVTTTTRPEIPNVHFIAGTSSICVDGNAVLRVTRPIASTGDNLRIWTTTTSGTAANINQTVVWNDYVVGSSATHDTVEVTFPNFSAVGVHVFHAELILNIGGSCGTSLASAQPTAPRTLTVYDLSSVGTLAWATFTAPETASAIERQIPDPTGALVYSGGTVRGTIFGSQVTSTNPIPTVGTTTDWNAGWTATGHAGAATGSTPFATVGDFWIRSTVTNGVCPMVTSNWIQITVTPSDGIHMSGPNAVCAGQPHPLSFSGEAFTNNAVQAGEVRRYVWTHPNYDTLVFPAPWPVIADLTTFNSVGPPPTEYETFNSPIAWVFYVIEYQLIGGGGEWLRDTLRVRVDSVSIGGTISPNDLAICEGDDIALNLSGHRGTILGWQFSATNTFADMSSGLTQAGEAIFTRDDAVPADSGYFRAVVQRGVCPPVAADPVLVVVNTATVPGAITPPATTEICATGTGITLALDGNQVGNVVRWEFSANNSAPWTNRGGTATTFTTGTSVAADSGYFRAIIRNGVCDEVPTPAVFIAVYTAPLAGSLTVDENDICAGDDRPVLTLAIGTGTIQQWQFSPSNLAGSWTNAASRGTPTGNTFAIDAEDANTGYFRAVVAHGPCVADTSNYVHVEIRATDAAGEILNTLRHVFYGADLTLEVVNIPANAVGLDFVWQSSTTGGTPWTTIASGGDLVVSGTDNNTLTITNFTGRTWFRAIIPQGGCDRLTSTVQVRSYDELEWDNDASFTLVPGETPADPQIHFTTPPAGGYVELTGVARGSEHDNATVFNTIDPDDIVYVWEIYCPSGSWTVIDDTHPDYGPGVFTVTENPDGTLTLNVAQAWFEDPANEDCQFRLTASWTGTDYSDGPPGVTHTFDTARGPFVIRLQPVDMPEIFIVRSDTICIGGTANFAIGTLVVPTPNWNDDFDIRWYVDGTLVPGANQTTLTYNGVTTESAGISQVVAQIRPRGQANPMEDATTVLVVVPPVTILPFPSATISACFRVDGAPRPQTLTGQIDAMGLTPYVGTGKETIQWFAAGTPIPGATTPTLQVPVGDALTYHFTVTLPSSWNGCQVRTSETVTIIQSGFVADASGLSRDIIVGGENIQSPVGELFRLCPDDGETAMVTYTANYTLLDAAGGPVTFAWRINDGPVVEMGSTFMREVPTQLNQGDIVHLEIILGVCDTLRFEDEINFHCPTLQLDSIFVFITSNRRAGNDTIWIDRDSIFLNYRDAIYGFIGDETQQGNLPIGNDGRLNLCVGHIVYFEPRFSGYVGDLADMNLTFEWIVDPVTTYYVGEYAPSTTPTDPPITESTVGFRVAESETGEMTFRLIVRSGGSILETATIVANVRSTAHVAMHVAPTMFERSYFENQVINFMMAPGRFENYEFWRFVGERHEVDMDDLGSPFNQRIDGSRVGDVRANPMEQRSPMFSTRFPAGSIRELGLDRGSLNVPITVVGVAIDNYGCEAISDITIRLVPVPTVLVTEGSSEANRVLFPNFDVEVFNTWGIRIQGFGESRGWDPNFRGRNIHSGTFYYNARIPTPEGYITVSGAVTVMRDID